MPRLLTKVDPATGALTLGVVGRLRVLLGDYSPVVRFYRHHKPRWWWTRVNPVGRLTRQHVSRYGLTVRRGPFEGLRYPAAAVARTAFLIPKLVGTYERQLHDVFEGAGAGSTFVDIGCSDGFYCVGFARLHPGARVIGFETDRVERRIAVQMAELNDVAVQWRGTAGPDDIAALPAEGTLLMVDIEGAEGTLLDPRSSPVLRTVAVLVETHLSVDPGLEDLLTERFAPTHDVRRITSPAVPPVPPELAHLSTGDAALALSEGRVGSQDVWLHLTPRRTD